MLSVAQGEMWYQQKSHSEFVAAILCNIKVKHLTLLWDGIVFFAFLWKIQKFKIAAIFENVLESGYSILLR